MLKKLVRIRARKKEASWKENIRKYEWFTFPSVSITAREEGNDDFSAARRRPP